MAIRWNWLRVGAAAVAVGGLLAGGHLLLHRRAGGTVPAVRAVPLVLLPVASQPPPDPVPAVRAALSRYVAGRHAHAGIAVLDRVTGVAVGYNARTAFATASVVKLDILLTLLWQHQRTGRALTAGQRDAASEMITESDNDAADALWTAIGGAAGLAQANGSSG